MDPRLELAELGQQISGDAVLERLDGVRVIVEAPLERSQSHADQAALFTVVNLAARLFPHLELRLAGAAPSQLGLLLEGELGDGLTNLVKELAPLPSRKPTEEFHIAFGIDPAGPGLAGDAAGWNYSVGPRLIALEPAGAPAVGALASAIFLVAQLFGARIAPLGLPVVLSEGFTANLLDYQNCPTPELRDMPTPSLSALAALGCGSVGSSMILALLLTGIGGGPVKLVDPDGFSARNVLRYPVLRCEIDARKANWLAELAGRGGIEAQARVGNIQDFLADFEQAPAIDLAAVSVDTVEGRRDATDLLARRTLNVGVSGLSLHISSHGFGDEDPCSYCQYVDLAPSLSGSAQLAELIGLNENRVIEVNLGDGRISAADAAEIVANGKFTERAPCAGERLADLQRRIYAQAAIPSGEREEQVLVSAPFVSQFGGLLLAVEAIKQAVPELMGYRLNGRYDIDLTGPPPGFVRRLERDQSGRCLCYSAFRRRVYSELHGNA
jgi:hypothetical protein